MLKSLVAFLLLLVNSASFAGESSIYDAKIGSFKTDSGKVFNLRELIGHKVVLSMVYTSCQMACPMMIKKIKKIQKVLLESSIDALYVVVSFDSEFDTPARLTAFRKHHEITEKTWTLLVGGEKDTRFLSNLLEIKFSKNPKDQSISHDNKVVLLNEKGVLLKTLDGLSFDASEKLFN